MLSTAEEQDERWIVDYFAGRLQPEEVLHREEEFCAVVQRTGTALYTSVRMRSHYYRLLNIIEGMEMDAKWRDLMIEAAR